MNQCTTAAARLTWSCHELPDPGKYARLQALSSSRLDAAQRLRRDGPMTSITLRIPVDVVELLKAIAPRKGLTGYQALLKAYVNECYCGAESG